MDYKIVEKPSFIVSGKSLRVTTKDGENQRLIPQFWEQVMTDGSFQKLMTAKKGDGVVADSALGICLDFAPDMSEFTYMIAVETPAGGAPEGMTETAIPALTWAVFEATGAIPDAIQAVWGSIWSEFFNEGKYKHAAGPDLELYPEGDPMQPDYQFQIWVPVEPATQ